MINLNLDWENRPIKGTLTPTEHQQRMGGGDPAVENTDDGRVRRRRRHSRDEFGDVIGGT